MQQVLEMSDDQKDFIHADHPFEYLAYAYMKTGNTTYSIDIVNFLVRRGSNYNLIIFDQVQKEV